MPEVDLFNLFISIMEQIPVDYFVTGSVASIVYGEPRLTNDIDLVVHLREENIDDFIKAFPEDEFYCPPREILLTELLRSTRGHFNLIHQETGFRADVYFVGNDPFQRWAMMNKRKISYRGRQINIAPPEYVIIKKMEFFKEGGSEKHLNDIEGILRNSSHLIDMEFLQEKIKEFNLEEIFTRIK